MYAYTRLRIAVLSQGFSTLCYLSTPKSILNIFAYLHTKIDSLGVPPKPLLLTFSGLILIWFKIHRTPWELLVYPQGYAYTRLRIAVLGDAIIIKIPILNPQVHKESLTFQCLLCPKTFEVSQSLKIHISTVHYNIQSFQCELCLRTFPYKKNLKEHLGSRHSTTLLHLGLTWNLLWFDVKHKTWILTSISIG